LTNFLRILLKSELKKLVGSNKTYRKRFGDYRIIFEIVFNRLIIEIIKVGHRKDIYR